MKVSNKFYTHRTRNMREVEASAYVNWDGTNYPNNGMKLAITQRVDPSLQVELILTNEEAVSLALGLIKQAESNRDAYRKHVANRVQP